MSTSRLALSSVFFFYSSASQISILFVSIYVLSFTVSCYHFCAVFFSSSHSFGRASTAKCCWDVFSLTRRIDFEDEGCTFAIRTSLTTGSTGWGDSSSSRILFQEDVALKRQIKFHTVQSQWDNRCDGVKRLPLLPSPRRTLAAGHITATDWAEVCMPGNGLSPHWVCTLTWAMQWGFSFSFLFFIS